MMLKKKQDKQLKIAKMAMKHYENMNYNQRRLAKLTDEMEESRLRSQIIREQ